MGGNLLAAFDPNFSSMAWIPSVTYTLPVPEGAPLQDATAPGATTDPGLPISSPPGPHPGAFPPAGPEDAPPP